MKGIKIKAKTRAMPEPVLQGEALWDEWKDKVVNEIKRLTATEDVSWIIGDGADDYVDLHQMYSDDYTAEDAASALVDSAASEWYSEEAGIEDITTLDEHS